jgi:hypothetical protein
VHRIPKLQFKHKVLGWVSTPETLTDRTSVTERTGMYSQRVSGMLTHPKASKKNPPAPKAVTQQILDNSCEPERLRAAHPCALSRSTVHTPGHPLDHYLVSPCPVHKTLTDRTSVTERTRMYSQRVSGVLTLPKASIQNPVFFDGSAKTLLSRWCKTDTLRVAHPCALSRSTVHPVHKECLPTPRPAQRIRIGS